MKPTLIAAPVVWAVDAEPVDAEPVDAEPVDALVVLVVDALFLLLELHAAKRAAIVTAHKTDKTFRRVPLN
jgi:hypothetical protein